MESPYAALKRFSEHFFSLFHDAIEKISHELKGTSLCTITPANQIIKMLWSLKEIDGDSLNPRKLFGHIIQQILSIKPILKNTPKYH